MRTAPWASCALLVSLLGGCGSGSEPAASTDPREAPSERSLPVIAYGKPAEVKDLTSNITSVAA